MRFQYKPVLSIFNCCISNLFILPYFKPAVNYPNMQNIFKNLSRKIYTFTQKKRADRNLPVKNSPKHYVGANSVRPPVVHYRNLFLFQRRFKPSHNNISRLNSVLLVKWRSVTKRIIQTKLLVLYLAHSVIRQNVKRFQRLEL